MLFNALNFELVRDVLVCEFQIKKIAIKQITFQFHTHTPMLLSGEVLNYFSAKSDKT